MCVTHVVKGTRGEGRRDKTVGGRKGHRHNYIDGYGTQGTCRGTSTATGMESGQLQQGHNHIKT